MPQELGPEAERRLVLKHFIITEAEIKRLKKLHPDDARFYIESEHNAQVRWHGRRRDFLLLEVFGIQPKKKTTRGKGTVVTPRGNPGQAIRGDKIG